MPKFLSTVCKFTPLGFETHFLHSHGGIGSLCVNLPRWGLKHKQLDFYIKQMPGVNLPRWGLKLRGYGFFHR